MGVRGFTTYMAKHSILFHKFFELKDCYIIIDGSGVAINLYVWHTISNDCFGGDYDSYAATVHKFFNLLKTCNVTPIILLDGSYENRKLRTVFKRMKNRIGAISRLNSSMGQSIKVFPLFTREVFEDIALSLGIKCIRNDHESDSEIACLGRYLSCPILGYDSDFYFFDALYIPFDKFEMKSVRYYDEETKTHKNYIPCQVYNIDYFLNYFGGLDKTNLPLLPVLLGNDYVKKSIFSAFYKHIKLKKSKSGNEQQRLIKTVISWLQHETLESAISKILGRFKSKRRRFILFKLKSAMKGYQQVSSTITDYLKDIDITFCENNKYDIDIENIEPTYETEMLENGSDSTEEDGFASDSSEIKNSDMDDDCDELVDNLVEVTLDEPGHPVDEETHFVDRYRQCNLPRCFADIKWRNTYFCIPQVENYAEPNSHRISLEILSAIHKILTTSAKTPLVCVLRTVDTVIRKERVAEYSGDLPGLIEISNLSISDRKTFILKILKIDETFCEFLNMFPSNWHLFLISLHYWKKNSQKTVDVTFIYSLLLCAIILHFVDSKVGICRTQKAYRMIKSKSMKDHLKSDSESNTLVTANEIEKFFVNIDHNESVLCLEAFLKYFNILPKKPIDKRLNEAMIVGYFSEFQSCALHIKYLNNLFHLPFDDIMFSKFFCGTFLYNTVVDFRRRSNVKSYLELLLKDCENILSSLNLIMMNIETYFGELCESNAKKRRKRKKTRNNQEKTEEDSFPDGSLF